MATLDVFSRFFFGKREYDALMGGMLLFRNALNGGSLYLNDLIFYLKF